MPNLATMARSALVIAPSAPAPVTVPGSHDLPPWPDSAPHVAVNGTPIDPNDYGDDAQFRAAYQGLFRTYNYGDVEAADAKKKRAAGDAAGAAKAQARATQIYGTGPKYIMQIQNRVAQLASDPGRWIVQHDPIAAFVDAISKGEPIDQVFNRMGDAVVKNVKDVGPYVQTVCSFIPGFGTAVAACIGAAVAIANGEPLGDGLIDTVGGCLPGGVVTGMAFRAGVTAIKDACQGETWQQIAWDSAREAMPPGPARMCFDAATSIAGAAIAQSDPKAYQAVFTGAQQNGAAAYASVPAPKIPSAGDLKAHGQAAQSAYLKRALPPAPPWTPSTILPATQGTTPSAKQKAAAVGAGAVLISVLFRI